MENVNKWIRSASFRSRLTQIVQNGIIQYIHNSTNYNVTLEITTIALIALESLPLHLSHSNHYHCIDHIIALIALEITIIALITLESLSLH